MGRTLFSTSCACWCDGCTFSSGYEMLCICFKAAGGDVSPAAGQSAAFNLMWYVPSGAAVIVITIGKREFAICWIHCFCKEVPLLQRGKTGFAEHWFIWNKKIKGFLVDFWQPSRHVFSGGFCSIDFETSPCICPASYEIFLYAQLRAFLFPIF